MATFRDTEHLYQVLDFFFTRLMAVDDIAAALHAGSFVLRFRYSDPDGQVTIDLRELPIKWEFGATDLEPDLEMIQSGDTAHQFWLGRLNVPAAIATRKVVSRGPIAKALKLLPAIKPAFPIYAAALRELGEDALLPAAAGAAATGWQERLFEVVDRVRKLVPGDLRSVLAPLRKAEVSVDRDRLNAHLIPLVDGDAEPAAVVYRDQELPYDGIELRLEMLARMNLIREFEQLLARAYADGEVPTEAIHLSIGQEATAVGACFALRADDYIATTHRGHGHMLAKGADLDGMMAELLGKATGLCAGKGGSMHVTEAAVGAIGANGIVGASPLAAIGAAHAAVQRGSDQVAVAFLGDGATNQGMFHEALNFAAVFDLPAVFVVENNQYGEFTAVEDHTRVPVIAERAAAYGMPGVTVDGNDCQAVYAAARTAVARARAGDGPTLLECLTYRWHGHMEGEDVGYRSAEEIAEWKERCPIKALRAVLAEEGLAAADAAEIEEGARARVEAAWDKAKAGPEPAASTMTTDVFAPEPRYLYAGVEVAPGEREITFSQALYEAIAEELERDERVYLLGEDVATGGYFAVTVGLVDKFGAERIIDTPISEYAIVGSAVGAAMSGQRPIAEILFSDFLTTCMDPIVNNAAKLRYMSGGQYRLPMVVRTPGGAGLGMAAQHSQSLEALLTGIPGLIVVAPATPYDAKGLLKAAIRSNNPVIFFENKVLYAATGPVPEGDYVVPLGVARRVRRGGDITVVSVGGALGKVEEAAALLAADGIEVDIVDVRTLVPLDVATIVESVVSTGRLVTVEDAALTHGFGAEVIARVAEAAWPALVAPPRRVAALDVPIPYNSALENQVVPDAGRIEVAVREVMAARAPALKLPWRR